MGFGLTEHVIALTRPIVKRYFRSEVRGLDNIPSGASLVVSNHSGGLVSFDLSVLAVGYYDNYGDDRPLYALGFDTLFAGPAAEFFKRTGVIRVTRDNAAKALATGAVVLVFPGGDFDVYRPTMQENVINFGAQRLRHHGHEGKCADRSRSLHRRTGRPAVLDPRQRA
jgi:1-acyl-sn-glycerol-3-phosphate acyltransferase